MSSCGTLRQATRLLEAAGQDNAHLLIDKFLQAGARISDLQDVHPSSLKYIHLSAAPLRHRPPSRCVRRARWTELAGGGEYPLVKLLNAHPAGIPIAVEARTKSFPKLTFRERSQLVADATQRLIAKAPPLVRLTFRGSG